MADFATTAGDRLRVAVGIADADAAPLVTALEDVLSGHEQVLELVRYIVVCAHREGARAAGP